MHGHVTLISCSPEAAAIIASGGRISTMDGTADEIYAKSLAAGQEKNEKLIGKVLSSGHTSVLEHCYVNLSFENVSVLAEQFLIEFRLASFTVKSRRYVDFSGAGYVAPDFSDPAQAAAFAVRQELPDREPRCRVTLYQGLCKGEKMDFLVQKCTEAGAAEIVFFSCTRCVAKAVNMEKKLERWQRIAEEAAKQSGRGIIPQVRYEADFVAVLNDALHTDLPLFMYETGERETIRDAIEHTAQPIASAAIITGPEGGFAEFEADMARKLGMHICSMGERILRCETAPVVALTALMYGTGNL